MNDRINPFIIVCPRCGYSFRSLDPIRKRETKQCPMCGYKFIRLDFSSPKTTDSNQHPL